MARIDRDRALGALLGLAVGDALGAPLESAPPAHDGDRQTEMVGGGPYGVRPGQGTGTTQMALRLAQSIVDLGGYDEGHALQSYVAWYRTDPPGMSAAMRQVLATVAAGSDSFHATSSIHAGGFDTAGNGALMRATPLGVLYAGRDQQLRDATLADAALTHFDPLAGKVALVHNQAIGWLVTGGSQRLVAELKDPSGLDDRIEDVVIPATAGILSMATKLAASEPGSALASLAVGLAAAFNADSFEAGVVWAANLGGDASVNGAVTGALMGARLGAAAIPPRWREALERRAELEGLAERLIALSR
jgi:ADP-ribosyl-[dinitrogen reductase] hydrolase